MSWFTVLFLLYTGGRTRNPTFSYVGVANTPDSIRFCCVKHLASVCSFLGNEAKDLMVVGRKQNESESNWSSKYESRSIIPCSLDHQLFVPDSIRVHHQTCVLPLVRNPSFIRRSSTILLWGGWTWIIY